MADIQIRPRAQLDIESIYLHISIVLDSPLTANRLIDTIYSSIERLGDFPELGERFTHEGLENSYRRILVNQYWVYYTFNPSADEVAIWRIFHTSRDIDDYAITDL